MRILAILIALLLAWTAAADGGSQPPDIETPVPVLLSWYGGAGAAIGVPIDTQGEANFAGLSLWAGKRVHRFVSTEAKFDYVWGNVAERVCPYTSRTYCRDMRRDSTVWKLMGRAKVHGDETIPTPLRFFYALFGMGIIDSDRIDPSFALEIGGGMLVPVWQKIHLVTEAAYLYNHDKGKLDDVVTTVGLQYRWP